MKSAMSRYGIIPIRAGSTYSDVVNKFANSGSSPYARGALSMFYYLPNFARIIPIRAGSTLT